MSDDADVLPQRRRQGTNLSDRVEKGCQASATFRLEAAGHDQDEMRLSSSLPPI
jgi:hypothetical protein